MQPAQLASFAVQFLTKDVCIRTGEKISDAAMHHHLLNGTACLCTSIMLRIAQVNHHLEFTSSYMLFDTCKGLEISCDSKTLKKK
jgi:hypothetical protein